MKKHDFRFMEVENYQAPEIGIERHVSGGGFVAVCEETGVIAVTNDDDSWKGYLGAPVDPIERLGFALNVRCRGKKEHVHEPLDEAAPKKGRKK